MYSNFIIGNIPNVGYRQVRDAVKKYEHYIVKDRITIAIVWYLKIWSVMFKIMNET